MPVDVKIWEISSGDQLVEIKKGKLNLEERIEEWMERDVSALAEGMLAIGRQVPTDYGGYIDLLCLDSQGDVVIVELKRDKTPREVVAQVLDYASWVKDLSSEEVASIAEDYLGKTGSGPLDEAFKRKFAGDLKRPKVGQIKPPKWAKRSCQTHCALLFINRVYRNWLRMSRILRGLHQIVVGNRPAANPPKIPMSPIR
ncbi:MAG: endonuclease NucS domain-containing protein [Terriglobia bacterium]|jgi:hypothetical protein